MVIKVETEEGLVRVEVKALEILRKG